MQRNSTILSQMIKCTKHIPHTDSCIPNSSKPEWNTMLSQRSKTTSILRSGLWAVEYWTWFEKESFKLFNISTLPTRFSKVYIVKGWGHAQNLTSCRCSWNPLILEYGSIMNKQCLHHWPVKPIHIPWSLQCRLSLATHLWSFLWP